MTTLQHISIFFFWPALVTMATLQCKSFFMIFAGFIRIVFVSEIDPSDLKTAQTQTSWTDLLVAPIPNQDENDTQLDEDSLIPIIRSGRISQFVHTGTDIYIHLLPSSFAYTLIKSKFMHTVSTSHC